MKVLIIGLGSIAKKHIQAIQNQYKDFDFYALRSNKNSATEKGIINLYDFNDLEVLKVDFAIISNPTSLHQQAIEPLVKYKIPLFIEKPIFNTLSVGNLLKTLEENNIITYVACNLRFLGCISYLKTFLDNKRINEVNSYCGSYLPEWRPGKDFRSIYSANKEMGGGVHIDLIHEIDYLYWLFGPPQKALSYKSNKSSLNISAVDYANYLLIYPEFSASIVLNYYRRDAKRSLEIVTEDGTVYANLLDNSVTYNGNILFKSDKIIKDTYEDQLRFFIDEVLGNKVKFNTADEAFEILKLCITND
jgi:predicted dehydrogenase